MWRRCDGGDGGVAVRRARLEQTRLHVARAAAASVVLKEVNEREHCVGFALDGWTWGRCAGRAWLS